MTPRSAFAGSAQRAEAHAARCRIPNYSQRYHPLEAIEANERLAHKNAVLQARLARALEFAQAVAERRMPRYRRELDTLVCDYCNRASQCHHTFRHGAECTWEQARALLAEEAAL
jgi:hypothetical protein